MAVNGFLLRPTCFIFRIFYNLIRRRRRLKFAYLFVFFVIFIILAKSSVNEFDEIIEEIESKGLKSVQLLTQRFYFPNWGLEKLGQSPFLKCPEKRCYAFQPHFWSNKPFENSDGVIVHVPDLHYMPSNYKRNPKQIWLFYTMEPQRYTYCSHYYSINELDNWFNLTATFKPNSDVVVSYTSIKSLSDISKDSSYMSTFLEYYTKNSGFFEKKLLKTELSKKSLALWFVSHCSTSSRREDYIQELQKYIPVDIYGGCKFTNSRSDPCRDDKSNECINRLFNSYKFYLAFENSNCDYYITEKYWQFYYREKFFSVNIVPVVQGAREEHYGGTTFGHKTFIHADNFDSPRSLAHYLAYLDRNQTAYLEYFEWKRIIMKRFEQNISLNKTISTSFSSGDVFCEMCAKLHNSTYLNTSNNPSVKITEFFNPIRDCRDHGDPNYIKTFLKNIIGKCV